VSLSHPTLRPETPEDQPFLAQLYATTRQQELDAAGLTGAIRDVFVAQQFRAQTSGYILSFPFAKRWIILAEATDVGRLIVSHTDSEIRVVNLALLPTHQGRGIGTQLIRDLQTQATNAKVPLRLHVTAGGPAEKLYQRLGFLRTEDPSIHVSMEWTPPTGRS
jgi:GNAT superfamily N-acetyltransferase